MTDDYQRGYAAGRRYADLRHEQLIARMALAAAIAPKILDSPWSRTEGEQRVKLNTVEGIAAITAKLAKAIEQRL